MTSLSRGLHNQKFQTISNLRRNSSFCSISLETMTILKKILTMTKFSNFHQNHLNLLNHLEPPNIDEAISTAPDPLADLKEILISNQGMKIDRNLYRSFKKKVTDDAIIKGWFLKQNFDEAETYLKDKVLDKPNEFFTIEKIRKSLGLDRQFTVPELLTSCLWSH